MFMCTVKLQLLMTDERKDGRRRQSQLFNTGSSLDRYFLKANDLITPLTCSKM